MCLTLPSRDELIILIGTCAPSFLFHTFPMLPFPRSAPKMDAKQNISKTRPTAGVIRVEFLSSVCFSLAKCTVCCSVWCYSLYYSSYLLLFI